MQKSLVLPLAGGVVLLAVAVLRFAEGHAWWLSGLWLLLAIWLFITAFQRRPR